MVKYQCKFQSCYKIYKSTDGVRKHARKHHSIWLKEQDKKRNVASIKLQSRCNYYCDIISNILNNNDEDDDNIFYNVGLEECENIRINNMWNKIFYNLGLEEWENIFYDLEYYKKK